MVSSILPIVFFLLYRKRNQEKKLWVIFIYCCISMLVDVSYKHLAEGIKNREFEFFSFITFAEYYFFSLFFYFTYYSSAFKRSLIACGILFFIILSYNIIYNKGEDFDSLSSSAEAVFIVFFSVLYFYEEINDPNVTFIYGTKTFWIVIAFLLYLSVNLFPFIARNFVTETDRKILSSINNIGNTLKNVLFVVAFRMFPPNENITLNRSKSS